MSSLISVQLTSEDEMPHGKRFPAHVRALAEALCREGWRPRDILSTVHRVTGEKVDSSTLRRWRLAMKRGQGALGAPIYAELAKRLSRADLVQGFRFVMQLASSAWRETPHLSLEQLSRVLVLKLCAWQCGWPDFDSLAESLAYQWEGHGRLRERMPGEDERVHRALCYLWGIEREVGSDAVARAWQLKEERRPLMPPPDMFAVLRRQIEDEPSRIQSEEENRETRPGKRKQE